MKNLIEKARSILKQLTAGHDRIIHILSVSGGKDSTAMYLLALELGFDFHAVFADTGNEHQITLDYIRDLPRITGGPEIITVRADFTEDFARKKRFIAAKWAGDGVAQENIDSALKNLKPSESLFLDCCKVHGLSPGSATMRFCTMELKQEPINEYHDSLIKQGFTVINWVGIRAEESKKRAELPTIQPDGDKKIIFRPLIDWTIEDVIGIHASHNIEMNPLYQMGMKRVGCLPCVNSTKEEIRQIALQFPECIDKIELWEKEIQTCVKSGKATFFSVDKTPIGAKTKDPNLATIDHVVAWAKTTRGGDTRQQTFDLEDHSCMSSLGACE